MGHDLSVQHEVVERKSRHGLRDLRERAGRAVAVPRPQAHLVPGSAAQHPVAVQLELEDPSGPREGLLPRLSQHQIDLGGPQLPRPSPRFVELRAERGSRVESGAQLIDGEPGEHGSGPQALIPKVFVRADVLLLPDEEPLVLGFGQLHQGPHPAQLEASKLEQELARLEPLDGIVPCDPRPAIPQDHGPRSVVAFGNDSLEVHVLERMILYVYRQSLLGRVQRWSLRHRPGGEGAFDLQTEVVVQARGVVELDAEHAAARGRLGGLGLFRSRFERLRRRRCLACRFRGGVGASLFPVSGQLVFVRHGFRSNGRVLHLWRPGKRKRRSALRVPGSDRRLQTRRRWL